MGKSMDIKLPLKPPSPSFGSQMQCGPWRPSAVYVRCCWAFHEGRLVSFKSPGNVFIGRNPGNWNHWCLPIGNCGRELCRQWSWSWGVEILPENEQVDDWKVVSSNWLPAFHHHLFKFVGKTVLKQWYIMLYNSSCDIPFRHHRTKQNTDFFWKPTWAL